MFSELGSKRSQETQPGRQWSSDAVSSDAEEARLLDLHIRGLNRGKLYSQFLLTNSYRISRNQQSVIFYFTTVIWNLVFPMPRPLHNQYCLSLCGSTGGLQSNPQDRTHTWTNSTTDTSSQWASEIKGMDTGDAPVSQGDQQRLLRRHALGKGLVGTCDITKPESWLYSASSTQRCTCRRREGQGQRWLLLTPFSPSSCARPVPSAPLAQNCIFLRLTPSLRFGKTEMWTEGVRRK